MTVAGGAAIRRRRLATATCALLALAPTLAGAGPADHYYERTVMVAADIRCDLFTPAIGSALAAAQAQARGAALRAGVDSATLAVVARNAQVRADATACDSEDLDVAARRVRSAFELYSKLGRMTYPGEIADWRADRGTGRAARWRLAQNAAFGWDRMVFGIAGREGSEALMAVAMFADGQEPYAARLVMRDVARTSGPYLDQRTQGGRATLAKRLPPDAVLSFSAEARSAAGLDLLPKNTSSGVAFRFPRQALRAMGALDPRESVAVEFLFAGDRDSIRKAYVEVGDFAAGQAFLRTSR